MRVPRRLARVGAAADLPDAAAFDAYVGPSGEITVDHVRGIIALHDGVTAGGIQFTNDAGLLPDGGTTGQVLAKASNADGDVAWVNQSGGGGGVSEITLLDTRFTMLMTSKAVGTVLFGGAGGEALHDGFKTLDYVNVPGATNTDAGESGKLKPKLEGETTSDPTTTSGIGTLTMFSRSFSLDNNKTVKTVGVYSNTAGTLTIKIALRNSSTSYTVVVSQAVTHPGTGWVDFELSSPYAVPASGTYHVGAHGASANYPVVTAQPRAYVSGNASLGNITVTENTSDNAWALRVGYDVVLDASVSSYPITASEEPELIRALFLLENPDDAVLNTDVFLDLSRDGGATWATPVLSELYEQPANVSVIDTGVVDVSGQPAGSSLMWRWRTDNGVEVKMNGIALWTGATA